MADGQPCTASATAVQEQSSYTIQRRKRYWEVRDSTGELVCLTVYKRGAEEVIDRLLTTSR